MSASTDQSLPMSELARLWTDFSRGDIAARDRLLGLYYTEFRRVARRILSGDSHRLRLQPTDLVHEAIVRLLGGSAIAVTDRTHLLSLAARVMRNTLIDEVRKHHAAKRGTVVTLWPEAEGLAGSFDLELFDLSLERLARIEPEGARIVELRFFAGMTLPEIAAALDLSESTVQRRWRTARAWLIKELNGSD
ncbi:ECF-type sigma factor [Novosphingobium piscinae]|uniref:Sigma-70 family RNA polymerase sigma factor n=1 Tax=Novosphingobium piscinae TaxID=1507448 RepID=A0A7X1KQI4_9SPHN|nr:ECF-type sigma factor [Novosphingobium piscinae]MBC2669553.1 sigma-70 family RNA polymerase sigma factor [Novosphingobium piscinae]